MTNEQLWTRVSEEYESRLVHVGERALRLGLESDFEKRYVWVCECIRHSIRGELTRLGHDMLDQVAKHLDLLSAGHQDYISLLPSSYARYWGVPRDWVNDVGLRRRWLQDRRAGVPIETLLVMSPDVVDVPV